MEEKASTKISLSTFLLVIATIAIVIMGVFIYKLNNEKTIETQKPADLQTQVSSLNSTVNNLTSGAGALDNLRSGLNATNNTTSTIGNAINDVNQAVKDTKAGVNAVKNLF